jgi:hypothetical protein
LVVEEAAPSEEVAEVVPDTNMEAVLEGGGGSTRDCIADAFRLCGLSGLA